MQRALFALTALIYVVSSNAAEPQSKLYFDSTTFAYSETSSVKQIVFDDFEGEEFDGGKHSFTHNIWELGVTRSGWKFASLIRYDYVLEYSEDTAELIYADKNDLAIENGRDYEVYLDAVHARSQGLKLGYQFEVFPRLKVGMDVSYLTTTSYLDGTINGEFTVETGDYSGELALDYIYDTDKLLKREVDAPTGKGYAVDINVDWKATERLTLKGKWVDVISKIKFEKAPYTTAQASSDRVSLDSDGRIDIKPALSGREGFRKHTLELPMQMDLQASYRYLPDLDVTAIWSRYDQLNFPSLGIVYAFSDNSSLNTRFDFKSDALTLGVSGGNWFISLTSDRFDLSEARTFGLDIGVAVSL